MCPGLYGRILTTILPADKGNATVALNSVDYSQKIGAVLQDPAYRRLAKDPQRRSNTKPHFFLGSQHLQRRFANDYVLWVQDLRGYVNSSRFIRGVPLRPVVSIVGVPTYRVSEYLAGILSLLVKNSIEFVHTWVLYESDQRT
jgi:hypothetical protein